MKDEKKEIDAIIGSIKKWDLIAHGLIADEGGANCPLCLLSTYRTERDYYKLVYRRFRDTECYLCPIKRRTDEPQCRNTPYRNYNNCTLNGVPLSDPDAQEEFFFFTEACDWCEQEIEFLISLLPDEMQKKYDLSRIKIKK